MREEIPTEISLWGDTLLRYMAHPAFIALNVSLCDTRINFIKLTQSNQERGLSYGLSTFWGMR